MHTLCPHCFGEGCSKCRPDVAAAHVLFAVLTLATVAYGIYMASGAAPW